MASGTEIDAEDAAASRSAGAAGVFAQVTAAETSEDLFLEGFSETLPCPSAGLLGATTQSVAYQGEVRTSSTVVIGRLRSYLLAPRLCLRPSDQHRPCCDFLLAQHCLADPNLSPKQHCTFTRSQSEVFHWSFKEAMPCHLLWCIYMRDKRMCSPAH